MPNRLYRKSDIITILLLQLTGYHALFTFHFSAIPFNTNNPYSNIYPLPTPNFLRKLQITIRITEDNWQKCIEIPSHQDQIDGVGQNQERQRQGKQHAADAQLAPPYYQVAGSREWTVLVRNRQQEEPIQRLAKDIGRLQAHALSADAKCASSTRST